jgi:hypothetical protein
MRPVSLPRSATAGWSEAELNLLTRPFMADFVCVHVFDFLDVLM